MTKLKTIFLLICFAAGMFGVSAEFSSYAILKEIDVPEYDEWRFSFNLDSYTYEHFALGEVGTTKGTNWHESLYSISAEWGFWTFPIGDLSIGATIPFYFWYAASDLRDDNRANAGTGAETKFLGLMDVEIFADFKSGLTEHVSLLLHGGVTIPEFSGIFNFVTSLAKTAEEGGAAYGVMRMTGSAGLIIKYPRFISKITVGAELGNSPAIKDYRRTPALLVPQVVDWDNTSIMFFNIDLLFSASAATGFGLEYRYKGAYFAVDSSKWVLEFGQVLDPLEMIIIKMYFSSTSGGFYGAKGGSIMSIGIGAHISTLFGTETSPLMGTDPDLNPDILYVFSYSKYF